MARAPSMPFVYDDDPDDAENVPRAADLDYVHGADCHVAVTLISGERAHSMYDEAWSNDLGITSAWLTVDDETFIDDVSHYA